MRLHTVRILATCLCFAASIHAVFAQQQALTPHSIPWEFASERFSVRVNGQPVRVMLTAMNIHAASFDLVGKAEVRIEVNPNDYNRVDGKTYLKPEEFWQDRAMVRPASRAVRTRTVGRTVTFTIREPGQYSIERPGTGGFEDEVLLLFANPPEEKVPDKSENLRIEEPATLFGVNWPQATFRNFRFKNLDFTSGTAPSFLRAEADGITCDQIIIKGRPAETLRDLELTTDGKMNDVRFLQSTPSSR